MRAPALFIASAVLASSGLVSAATVADHGAAWGRACSVTNQRYDQNTYNLVTDCDAQTYCATNNTCAYKGCRKDIFPYGYNYIPFEQLPPLCPLGSFCPDEADRCLPNVPVGGTCQKDRDDECALAPNYRDLANYLNVNGSICLDFKCQWANVSVGQTCINDNTRYTAYTDAGSEYAIIVSRDNCATNFYCDGSTLQCNRVKVFGATCSGNKECQSYNCSGGKCGKSADEPVHPPTYAYVLIGIGIIGSIVGVIITLWFAHRKTRNENQRRLEQYWNEQMAYRQSIMSMYQTKTALLNPGNEGTPSRPQSIYNGPSATAGGDMAGLVPPRAMSARRDSEGVWSEEGSEVLLVPPEEGGGQMRQSGRQGGDGKWR